MPILNILIYDYTQKVHFDYTLAIMLMLFLLVGILLLKSGKNPEIKSLKPGLRTTIRLMLLRGGPKKNRMYGRLIIGFCVFLAGIYTYNFLLIKKPDMFNDLTHKSGRVENIKERTKNGIHQITFTVNREMYNLPIDKGYISSHKLTNGDSVYLDYMLDSNSRLTPVEKKSLVKLVVHE
jgi:hypothetical protein